LKKKFTIFLTLFFACSSLVFSQQGPFPKMKRESADGKEINKAAVQPNSIQNGLTDPLNAVGFQSQAVSSFSTEPGKISSYVPGKYYLEGFDDGSIPSDWQTRNITGSGSWTATTQNSFLGSGCVYLKRVFGSTETDWLITPQYTAALGDSLVFYISTSFNKLVPDTLWALVSVESGVPTDAASLNAAFSDTLLVIAVDTLDYGWFRYSVSLEKFAGQQIYIGFKDHNVNGCGVILDEIGLGKPPLKDVAYLSPQIQNYTSVNSAQGVSVFYFNKGNNTESFDVICEVPEAGFSKSFHINYLEPGDRMQAYFTWITEKAGVYHVTVRSTLSGDEYSGNDMYTTAINVLDALNPAVWHSETGRSTSLQLMGMSSYTQKAGDETQPDEGGLYIIGGVGTDGSGSSNSILFYDMNSQAWSSKSAVFPAAIRSVRSTQIGGKIYVPGGYINGTGVSSALYIYDIAADSLYRGADLLEAVAGYVIGTYGDSLIYVMCGYNTSGAQSSVQIYNVNTNTWQYGSPMVQARQRAAGSIAGNKIVIAGGLNAGNYFSSAEIGVIDPSDPSIITWETKEFPGGRMADQSAGSWYAKNSKYVFFSGGFLYYEDGSSTMRGDVWAYDVQYDKWFCGPYKSNYISSASDMVPIVKNGSVYMAVMGGYSPSYVGTFTNDWMYIGKYEPLTTDGKDIAAVSVILPDTLAANTAAVLKTSFTNRQLTTRSFDVTMEINPGGYTSTKTVSSLAYEAVKQIAFDAWTPLVGGDYTVKVYASLEGDEDKTNDTITTVIHAKKVDIAAKQVKRDVYFYPMIANVPVGYFVNNGEQDQTFNVTMEIAKSSYASTKNVMNLAAGDTAIVAFDDWLPDSSGNYIIKIYSSLATDEYKVNDMLSVSVQVQKVDIALTQSGVPTPVFAMTGTIPQAYFVNQGQQKQSFTVVMKIDSSSYTSIKTVKDLPAGSGSLVSFDSWTPAVSGNYEIKTYVSLINDEDRTNDTVKINVFVEKTDNSSTKINIESPAFAKKSIKPKASFENRGTHSQTFTVSMSIAPGDYYSEKTVTDLAASAASEVEFADWTPNEAGVYAVKVYSGAANDEDKTNDTLKTIIYALDELNAGAWHSEALIPDYFYNRTASSYTLRYAAGDSSFIFVISPYSKVPGYESDSSHSYNAITKRWIDRQAQGCDLINHRAIYAGGKVYLPGGSKSDSISSNMLFVYNPINNQWTREADLPEASSFHALGVYDDSLVYVIGGANVTDDSVAAHNGVQIYNVKTKAWKSGTAFEGAFKKSHTGGIIKNKIVLAGGLDYKTGIGSDLTVIGTIDSLNPYNITWETSSSPAGLLYGMASAACNSKQGAYVIFTGGRKTDNSISAITLAYDPIAGKWYRGADAITPSALSSGVTIARNDSLYFAVLGGENSDDISGLNDWLYLGQAIRDTNLIGIGDKPMGPLTYSLSQNYPNPFNPSTIIKYSVAQAGQVELKVYNMLGQEVITLVNEFKNAGSYEARFNAAGMNLSSGVYLYRIRAGSFVQTKKLVLIK
jgi:hypothetical protein